MSRFCSKCGKEAAEGAAFCSGCGNALGIDVQSTVRSGEQPEKIILESKGSLVGGGMGTIILTNNHIIWTKSAANLAMIGIASLITKGSTTVNIDDILSIGTFVFLGGAGLQVIANDGKKYKFGFNKKAERDKAMDYLKKHRNL